jgi:hypothetical protein
MHLCITKVGLLFSAMTDSGRALALAGTDEPTTSDDVIKVVKRFLLKSVGWVAIYLLGYYDFSVAWLITPLFLTVLRSQWKSERNFKLSAAREAALTDEKKMIESRIRVEDMPSWVFFPDKVSILQKEALLVYSMNFCCTGKSRMGQFNYTAIMAQCGSLCTKNDRRFRGTRSQNCPRRLRFGWVSLRKSGSWSGTTQDYRDQSL